jgi:hypothetical protein
MGLTSSPYFCIKALLIALEMVAGDRRSAINPFRWDRIHLNLPGAEHYDPSRPKISRLVADQLAAMILTYVDDMRATAGSQHNCWAIMHVVSTKLCYLGIQVALRKTRPPSQQPGPWSGAMILTGPSGIGVKATQVKMGESEGSTSEDPGVDRFQGTNTPKRA